MSDNLHISILEIFNDLKKKLSFSDETSIYPLTFDENKILFNNQLLNIDSSIKVDNFFSNSFLKYNSSFIPLFFYTTKSAIISNKKFIRKEANSLFINPLLKEILLSFNIQPDFLDTAYDAHEILFKLESALSFTDNTELVLVDGLCFFNYSISYAITLYPYLKRAIENPNTDLKLMPLFLTTPSSNKQEELLGQYKQSFETIIQERVVNVLTSDNNLSYDYILQIVNYNLSASKSVCIVTADDRDNKTLSEIFKKKYLSQFLLPLHAFNKNEFLEILNIPFRSHYNKTHRYELGNYIKDIVSH